MLTLKFFRIHLAIVHCCILIRRPVVDVNRFGALVLDQRQAVRTCKPRAITVTHGRNAFFPHGELATLDPAAQDALGLLRP